MLHVQMRWLSPLRKRTASEYREADRRTVLKRSALRIGLIAVSIVTLIILIAATHHPRTQVCAIAISMQRHGMHAVSPLVIVEQ